MPVKAPQLVFCRNESVSAGLRRIVDELIKSAIACIKQPSTDREEDLHQVRLAIKRLRAILPLLRPLVSKTFFKRESARLLSAARRLARLRDLPWRDERLNRSLTSSRAIHRTLQSRKSLHPFSLKPPHHLITPRTVKPRSDSLQEPSRKRAMPFTRCLCPIVVGKQSNRV
jgi:hypothetical protein